MVSGYPPDGAQSAEHSEELILLEGQSLIHSAPFNYKQDVAVLRITWVGLGLAIMQFRSLSPPAANCNSISKLRVSSSEFFPRNRE